MIATLATASAAAILSCAAAPVKATQARSLVQTDAGGMPTSFSVPAADFDAAAPSGCTEVMKGCTADFVDTSFHQISGTVTVVDDCTFEVSGWEFDGTGPAVEWWVDEGDPTAEDGVFPYSDAAKKVGEVGEADANGGITYLTGPLHGGEADIVVRLGLDDSGAQHLLTPTFNHISVWCEDFAVDFGNALLTCPDGPAAVAPAAEAEVPAAQETEADVAEAEQVESEDSAAEEPAEEEDDMRRAPVPEDEAASTSSSDAVPSDSTADETDAASQPSAAAAVFTASGLTMLATAAVAAIFL